MPHSTPARDLVRTAREALRERPKLESTVRDGTTKKQKRYAEHMLKVWKERVGEALRAYVNDLFVDDKMERCNLIGMTGARDAVIVTGKKRYDSAEQAGGLACLRNTSKLVAVFARSEPTQKTRRWFDTKTQNLCGMGLLEGKDGFFEFGKPISGHKYVNGVRVPCDFSFPPSLPHLKSGVADTTNGEFPFARGAVGTWGQAAFSTKDATPNATNHDAVQDVAKSVLEHSDNVEYDVRGGKLTPYTPWVSLRLTGFPGEHFNPPRVLLDQELDAEGFLRFAFHQESLFNLLPLDLKRRVFYLTVLFRSDLVRDEEAQRREPPAWELASKAPATIAYRKIMGIQEEEEDASASKNKQEEE